MSYIATKYTTICSTKHAAYDEVNYCALLSAQQVSYITTKYTTICSPKHAAYKTADFRAIISAQ